MNPYTVFHFLHGTSVNTNVQVLVFLHLRMVAQAVIPSHLDGVLSSQPFTINYPWRDCLRMVDNGKHRLKKRGCFVNPSTIHELPITNHQFQRNNHHEPMWTQPFAWQSGLAQAEFEAIKKALALGQSFVQNKARGSRRVWDARAPRCNSSGCSRWRLVDF